MEKCNVLLQMLDNSTRTRNVNYDCTYSQSSVHLCMSWRRKNGKITFKKLPLIYIGWDFQKMLILYTCSLREVTSFCWHCRGCQVNMYMQVLVHGEWGRGEKKGRRGGEGEKGRGGGHSLELSRCSPLVVDKLPTSDLYHLLWHPDQITNPLLLL